MAGDWVKMLCTLPDNPKVDRMAERLGIPPVHVVGCLMSFWSWAGTMTETGSIQFGTRATVDKHGRHAGLAAAMEEVGWLVVDDFGIHLPEWDLHNSNGAKSRALASMRQAKWRGSNAAVDGKASTPVTVERLQDRLPEKRREEKTREEKTKTEDSAATPKAASPPDLRPTIRWTVQGWLGILGEDKERWQAAYPACNIDRQLAAMDSWLRANPAKKKSNWPRFITNWLTRSQDQGGDIRSNGNGRQGNNGYGGAAGSTQGTTGSRPTAAKAQAAREFDETDLSLPIHRFNGGGGGKAGAVSAAGVVGRGQDSAPSPGTPTT